jgi:hypothetical protein
VKYTPEALTHAKKSKAPPYFNFRVTQDLLKQLRSFCKRERSAFFGRHYSRKLLCARGPILKFLMEIKSSTSLQIAKFTQIIFTYSDLQTRKDV